MTGFIILLISNLVAGELDGTQLRFKYPAKNHFIFDGATFGTCIAATTLITDGSYFSKDEMSKKFNPIDFYTYLSAPNIRKEASSFYKTGKEEQLKDWILSQSDNSVDPISLYKTSLKLSNGNVWNALLTIHELLRNNARYYDKSRYNYTTDQESVEKLFNKLIDIRGDLKERGQEFQGDHFGSWYRIWGVLLGSQMFLTNRGPEDVLARQCEGLLKNPGTSVKSLAAYLGNTIFTQVSISAFNLAKEGFGSLIGMEKDGNGKRLLNSETAKAANSIVLGLWEFPSSESNALKLSEKCTPKYYLVDFENFK